MHWLKVNLSVQTIAIETFLFGKIREKIFQLFFVTSNFPKYRSFFLRIIRET